MNGLNKSIVYVLFVLVITGCDAREKATTAPEVTDPAILAKSDTAYFAGGCFWCTEAAFERIEGVIDVVSGYSGGKKKNPTYRQVGAGLTDYAESIRIVYDPDVVTYADLVDMFFGAHDPTTLNRQGPDVGKQYRSAIFYQTEEEKSIAENIKNKLDASGTFADPIVTEITLFKSFYEAEDYHQNYYELHPDQPYVASVSRPKVEKFMKKYKDRLKEKYKH